MGTLVRFTLLALLTASSGLWADERTNSTLSETFDRYTGSTTAVVLSGSEVLTLLRWASDRGFNVFDLVNETALYLESISVRAQIRGIDLRNAAAFYRLGDHRVETLLPLSKLVSLTCGKRSESTPAVEVILSQEHSGFLELGDFYLEKRYGFVAVAPRSLQQAFGIKVKNAFFSWEVDRIDRVPDPTGGTSPNFIGIELRLFPRAKRWHIDAIRPY